jgi:hypothetical protein
MLDEQRQKEVNSMDMLQNTNILYHMESVLEMQFACLVAIYLMKEPTSDPVFAKKTSYADFILLALIVEHIFAYTAGVFRKWEVEKYGKLDVNGVYRAQKESLLSTIEIFVDCIIFGYTLNYLFSLSNDEF